MEFKITKLSDTCFLVSALVGYIPKADLSVLSEAVAQIKREFKVNLNGVRFFWPAEDQPVTVIVLARSN